MLTLRENAPSMITCPIRAGARIDGGIFDRIRRHMTLRACKWDPQVGDVCTLADFALLIGAGELNNLSHLAEQLAAELMACEAELATRPDLQKRLGLPRPLRGIFGQNGGRVSSTPSAGARLLRFDFHWTRGGWRISEVNSDVPGGLTESTDFPALMAAEMPECRPAGAPAAAWADAIAAAACENGHAALLAAAGYLEDLQIVSYLQTLLAERGVVGHLVGPKQLCWIDGRAHMETDWRRGEVGVIVRFFQAEWLASVCRRQTLRHFAGDSVTPIINAMSSAMTESKRFPLTWGALKTEVPTWRRLLMETRDPREASWQGDNDWILKSAYCNNGDDVAMSEWLTEKQRRRVKWNVRLSPGSWVAQRRFVAEPIDSEVGLIYPCLGVYTINGRAAGVYGRYARKPLIDFEAVDVAVLAEEGA